MKTSDLIHIIGLIDNSKGITDTVATISHTVALNQASGNLRSVSNSLKQELQRRIKK